jgi:DNA-binding NarL/FixJ family response regulator
LESPFRILIVDDFEPWRRFIAGLLQKYPEWEIVGEASDGEEGVQKTRQLQPDLILLDIGLPKLNGILAASSIRSIAPNSKILFLSENHCPDLVQGALSAGARGYVVKSDAAFDLLPAMRAVINDQRFVGSRFADCNFVTSRDK